MFTFFLKLVFFSTIIVLLFYFHSKIYPNLILVLILIFVVFLSYSLFILVFIQTSFSFSFSFFRSGTHCFFSIIKEEGIRGLYHGLSVNLVRGVGGAILLVGYDEAKTYLNESDKKL